MVIGIEVAVVAKLLTLFLNPKEADFLNLLISSFWTPQSSFPSGEFQSERFDGIPAVVELGEEIPKSGLLHLDQ